MLIAQVQYVTAQPLLIALIVIAVVNLLLTIALLKRVNGSVEMEPAAAAPAPAPKAEYQAPKRVYAGNSDVNSEIAAVISAALHFAKNEIHDLENTVLTIDKVSKSYSPWSSKIYGIRKNPR